MPWIKTKSGGQRHVPAKLSPAAKIALKALILGAVKSSNEAAKLSGLTPAWLSVCKNSPAGQGFMQAHEGAMDEKLIETSALMELLGREALTKMGGLMRFSADENIILRASADLMDRAPTTQKVHKVQAETLTLSRQDAKEIAAAMVESARARGHYLEAASGDFVRIAGQEEVKPETSDDASTG